MKTFIQHDFPKLERIDSNEARLYQTQSGLNYPSVTSVLSILNKQHIAAWRARVGEEEANRISSRASSRGTSMHSLCEEYLLTGQEPVMESEIPFLKKPGAEMFKSIQEHLDKIDMIHALESSLYSNHLKVAGTVDCIGEYEGRLSVIDFKTSSRMKSRDDIHSYFYQTSAYAVAFEELTGIPVDRLVIIMAVEDEAPLIFKEKRDDWIGGFIQTRKEFHNKTGY
jgi:genome maintenance exonuclease 1